jgi:hypothetical protein
MASYQQGIYQVKNGEKYIGKHHPKYRSGWELAMMRMLDNHPSILAWSSESHRIPYVHPITGKRTNYVPDFFVVYMDKDGKKHAEIVEVKPSGQTAGNARGQYDQAMAVINQAKWTAARAYCQHYGVAFRVVTEKEIFNRPQRARPHKVRTKAK